MPTSKGESKQNQKCTWLLCTLYSTKADCRRLLFFFMTKTKLFGFPEAHAGIEEQKILPPFGQGSSMKSEL